MTARLQAKKVHKLQIKFYKHLENAAYLFKTV